MPSAAELGRAHPLSDDATAQLNASILATAGTKLAPLLSVIRRSYLKRLPGVRRHCPPTNGVFATFLTGPPPQPTVPTMVASLVATSDWRLASVLVGSALRFKTSEATSKSA